ncbi:MAG: glycoside hydrolase family 3 C-terminal domain-containing protein [Bacteroidales bacterium]|nr:glycoside hydrolase family 3 C-terminal domain-containing protein [Bacteroidales bacterium]
MRKTEYFFRILTGVLFIGFLAILIGAACVRESGKSASQTTFEIRADSILAGMSLQEKVGQMTQITLDVFTVKDEHGKKQEPVVFDPDTLNLAFSKYKIGSILNVVKTAPTAQWWNESIEMMQEIAICETGIPLIYGIDAIHGASYTSEATLFPQQIAQGATFNPELIRQLNEMSAYEMRASNIPWTFSPVLDMGRDARDSRLWETYGEAVYLCRQMGEAAVLGLQGGNYSAIDQQHGAACLKHFLAYNSNSGKDRNPLSLSLRELKEIHAPSFQAAIDAGAKSIMINSGIINGLPVHANYEILTRLLRDEMGFKGLVVSDWADIENLHKRDKIASSIKEAVKIGINAGVDMSMVPHKFHFCDYLIELVNEGEVSMQRIDEAVKRVLVLKLELGLFDNPNTKLADYPEFGSKKFQNLALQAALESITLLKNKNNVLPLQKNVKVLFTGPNANSMRPMNGGWSYTWQGERTDEFAGKYNTFLEAIQNKIGKANVKFVEGVSYKMDGKYWEEENINIQEAVKASIDVDYILLFAGENSYCEKPGDLHDLYISENQTQLALALAKTNKPVILILNEGRPRLISKFEDKMEALIQTYLPANFGGDALADILFGDANPSGKLPYTYPMFPNSLFTYDYKPSENPKKPEGMYDYGSELALQYEFGHGLSYTTFEYSEFNISAPELSPGKELNLSIKVQNTGNRAGAETVLLYYSDLYASITPDNKKLCRFSKVELEPGEIKTISFRLFPQDFAFYNYNNQLLAEEGDFILRIQDFKQKIRLTETIKFDKPSKVVL